MLLECLSVEQLVSASTKTNYEDKVFTSRGNDGHTCSFCQELCSSRSALWEHIERLHLKAEKMFYDRCAKTNSTKSDAENINDKLEFKCTLCDFKTAVKTKLKTHKLTHRPKKECPICHKLVLRVKFHMKSHDEKVECPICKKLGVRAKMKRHMKTHMPTQINTHTRKCTTCSEIFVDNEELRRSVAAIK